MHTNTSAIFLAKLLSVALFALMVPVSSLAQQVIYVSPQGNDQWSGHHADALPAGDDGPLATVRAAHAKVRDLLKAGQGDAIEVQIRGGLYHLNETLVLGVEDSGTKAKPVTYKAYEDEEPVFSGCLLYTSPSPRDRG